MDDRVKKLLKELGQAISDAVTSSERIESIMQDIRDQGCDAHLLLEAIIALGDKHYTLQSESEEREDGEEEKFTAEDRRFLRRLKIEI
ncbi:MAG TPA: hypothetical protein VEZ90_01045 [Blastocatellia bacterium]|nr:hypothetical protein [Blastocatellia bacterium]